MNVARTAAHHPAMALWRASALLLLTLSAVLQAAVPAFPGAEGFGAQSVGGRGGRVIEVTNLDDNGPGSLRSALMSTGPRIVVFRVGGTIRLTSRLELRAAQSYLTIAGQTAPGDGIQIRGMDIVLNGTHDVIIRNLRLRPGETAPGDWSKHGLLIYGGSAEETSRDIIVDHCSIYWGPDENLCAWDWVENVTFQWCMTEGIVHDTYPERFEDSKAALFGTSEGDGSRMRNITLHHSYLANSAQRNPLLVADGPFHVVSNVVYNWVGFGTGIANRGTGVRVNLVSNHYRRGPASSTSRYAVGIDGDPRNPDAFVYVADNIGPFRPSSSLPEWAIVGSGYDTSRYWTAPADARYQRATPWPASPIAVQATSSDLTVERVLADCGAIAPRRDALDARLVADFRTGTGTIKKASEQLESWWPTLAGGEAPADADHDGMPDAWEIARGLSPTDSSDGPLDRDGDGWTNVEEYLNGLMSLVGPAAPELDISRGGIAIADGGTDLVAGTSAGTTHSLTYALGNSGTATLGLTVPVMIGSQNNCNATMSSQLNTSIAAGATADLVVTVTPIAGGPWSFTLALTNTDGDENLYEWNVSGAGVEPGNASPTVSTPGVGGGRGCGLGSGFTIVVTALAIVLVRRHAR